MPQQSALIRDHAGGAAQVTCWGGHAEVRRQQCWVQRRQGRREVGSLVVFVLLLLWLPRQLQVTLYPCFPVQGVGRMVRRLFTTTATCYLIGVVAE